MSARLVRGTDVISPLTSPTLDKPPVRIPEFTREQLEYLNAVFPDRLALVTSMGSLDRAAGAREVVNHIHRLIQEQET